MSSRVCVIDLPGMSPQMLEVVPSGSALGQWLKNRIPSAVVPSFPALTCSMQATLTTGILPSRHGMIASGIPTFRFPADADLTDPANFQEYRRTMSFWEQSNQFIQVPRFWQKSDGTSKYKTALLFFQNCMPGFTGAPKPAADIVLTPKPEHGADGRLTSLCWSEPSDLIEQLSSELGPFPLKHYWGPLAGIQSSQWIVNAAVQVWRKHQPTLQLAYVPHLEYDLQRFGAGSPQAHQAIQDLSYALDPLVHEVLESHGKLVLLSDYAIADVNESFPINGWLREAGLLKTHQSAQGAVIDFAASDAVALVDHQIAHIYTKSTQALEAVQRVFKSHPQVELLERAQYSAFGVDHARSGDLIVIAPQAGWFDYRWWSNPAEAPAFARTVDIHCKQGYDPLELFIDPAARAITQDARLVKGSHGRVDPTRAANQAVFVSDVSGGTMHAVVVAGSIARLIG